MMTDAPLTLTLRAAEPIYSGALVVAMPGSTLELARDGYIDRGGLLLGAISDAAIDAGDVVEVLTTVDYAGAWAMREHRRWIAETGQARADNPIYDDRPSRIYLT